MIALLLVVALGLSLYTLHELWPKGWAAARDALRLIGRPTTSALASPSLLGPQGTRTRFAGLAGEGAAPWVLFAVALLLRVPFLETTPNTVTADELDYAGDALQILIGRGPSFFGLDWTGQPALSLYLHVWSWQLFGATVFAERLPSALLTALVVFPFYSLARRYVSGTAAFCASLLFVSAHWFLLFSRSGWNVPHVLLYMLVAAWALTKALEQRRGRYWLVFGICLALLLYGYLPGRIVALSFALYLGGVLAQRGRTRNAPAVGPVLWGGLASAVLAIALFSPQLGTILTHYDSFTERARAVYIFSSPPPPGQSHASILGQQALITLRSYVLLDSALEGNYENARYKIPGQAWLDSLTATLYIVGLALSLLRWRRSQQSSALWWLLLILPVGVTHLLTSDIPNGGRAITALAPMCFFAAITLDTLLGIPWRGRRYVPGVLTAMVVVATLYNVVDYASWVNSPVSQAARQPAVPVSAFYTWRDFQQARLWEHMGIMNAGEYDQTSPSVILDQIARGPGLLGTAKHP